MSPSLGSIIRPPTPVHCGGAYPWTVARFFDALTQECAHPVKLPVHTTAPLRGYGTPQSRLTTRRPARGCADWDQSDRHAGNRRMASPPTRSLVTPLFLWERRLAATGPVAATAVRAGLGARFASPGHADLGRMGRATSFLVVEFMMGIAAPLYPSYGLRATGSPTIAHHTPKTLPQHPQRKRLRYPARPPAPSSPEKDKVPASETDENPEIKMSPRHVPLIRAAHDTPAWHTGLDALSDPDDGRGSRPQHESAFEVHDVYSVSHGESARFHPD